MRSCGGVPKARLYLRPEARLTGELFETRSLFGSGHATRAVLGMSSRHPK